MATAKKAASPKKETSSTSASSSSAKEIGQNLIVILDGEKISKKIADKTERAAIMNKVALYIKKPSKTGKETILKLMQPEAAKKAKEKEEVEVKTKAVKQQLKKETKKEVKEVGKKKAELQAEVAKSSDEDVDLIAYTKTGIALKGFEEVTMPNLLVEKIKDFLQSKTSIKPLLNFWSMCLLNPNEIARTKLFDYLSHHKFIITPSGYFVTYRMWKKTENKEIFTDARTGKMKYRVGEVAAIPRSECDEDGANDCSKGLHVGAPSFIGVSKGEGYDKEKGHIGTGYVDYSNQGYGDVPVICFVNPMHVVSIPNSDTRKLRCCEFYPFKLTTPEEIISVEDADYFIYENDYKKLELKELMESIDREGLKEFMEAKGDNYNKVKLLDLQNKLKNRQLMLNHKDPVAASLDLEEVKKLVNNRVTVLTDKYPAAIQL